MIMLRFSFLVAVVLVLGACREKRCSADNSGELCFHNRTDSFRVEVYLRNSKIHTLEPNQRECSDDIPAEAYVYQLRYLPLAPGVGYIRTNTLNVYACDRTVVEAR